MAWLLIAVAAVFVFSLAIGFVLANIGVIAIVGASYVALTHFKGHRRG
jgi:hypothetical protein